MNRKRPIGSIIIILLGILLCGCATITRQSVLKKGVKAIDISRESVAIFSMKLKNYYKPDHQPTVMYVYVRETGQAKNKQYSFAVDKPYRNVKKEYTEYLISLKLAPGKYKLREMSAVSGGFMQRGYFTVPIYREFELGANQVVYLGHIEANVIKRTKEEEAPAGPPLPLLDQIATGASQGTFWIEITDKYDYDVGLFTGEYPYLSSYNIENRTLPQWTRPTEQDKQ